MERVDLRDMYETPEDYKPPLLSELPTNTYYPNLNSTEYRHKPVDWDETKLHSYFEILTENVNGTLVLATNSYVDRIWNGSIWGYHEMENVGVAEKEVFKLRLEAPVTNMVFQDEDMVTLHFNFICVSYPIEPSFTIAVVFFYSYC